MLAREKGRPSGTGAALQLPLCALGSSSSPLLVPGLGSPRRDGGHSVPGGSGSLHYPPAAGLPASGLVPAPDSSREGQRGGEGPASSGPLRRGGGRRPLWGHRGRSLGPGGGVFTLRTGRPMGDCCPRLVLASATERVLEDEARAALALLREELQISLPLDKHAGPI